VLGYSFPKLTHLKLTNFERIHGDVNLFDFLPELISVVMGDFTRKEDVETMRMYCNRRRINFITMEEA
jgi:hypothetical protein